MKIVAGVMVCLLWALGCGEKPSAVLPEAEIEARVSRLLSQMTLAEKIGQMTLVDRNNVILDDIAALFVGGLLSPGGGYPYPNTP
ncbi:MAG TPA: beta-glucosidase, partial [Spirochaetia bacterium]|nr:beta-glucosidase [Spirochaetia bacterium]